MNKNTSREAMMNSQALQTIQPVVFTAETPTQQAAIASAEVLSPVLLVGAAIAVVCALFWTHAFGASSCHIRLAPYVFGMTSEVSATVPAGAPCTITLRPGSIPIEALTIESYPKLGSLTPRGRTGVIYRPHNKTSGSDEFVFAIHRGGASQMQKFVVRVSTEAK
jgi:hypothetical protein